MSRLSGKIEHLQIRIPASELASWARYLDSCCIKLNGPGKEHVIETVLRHLHTLEVDEGSLPVTEDDVKDEYFRRGWPRSK